MDWLENHNHFCNSLVDRIVPGKLKADEKKQVEEVLGYEDELMIMAEPYRLWAIESADPEVKRKLSFWQADAGVIIAPDISKFRELKLRLLNGTHTLNCGLAAIAGFQTVKEAMQNKDFREFTTHLMLDEIAGAIEDGQISGEDARQFGLQVLERFANPFIDHLWLSITLQYSSKMLMRNIPILQKHYQRTDQPPPCIALGFAAYLLFMKSKINAEQKFEGGDGTVSYLISDDKAELLHKKWNEKDINGTVWNILSDQTGLWGMDLTRLPGFAEKVLEDLVSLQNQGAEKTIKHLLDHYPAVTKHG
jgi:tagaturonate reductase